MPISRKPKLKKTSSGVDVDALIEKGGSVASVDTNGNSNKTKAVILRLPVNFLSRIDQVRSIRTIKQPRHTWLLEAVVEKLERESS